MSPPPIGVVEEEGQSNVTLLASSTSVESVCQNGSELKERNYMGLSECSSVDSSVSSSVSDGNKTILNLKATELRLGLPGSQSPERNPELCLLSSTRLDEKPFFPLHPSNDIHCSSMQKNIVSGNKRGISDVMVAPKVVQERPHAANETKSNHNGSSSNRNAPAIKAQVVGWPPIRSFRKNSLATTSKNTEEVDGKAGPSALFVKVSMDGAPYLRKIDLRNYSSYQGLCSALEKMFSCFTLGQYGSHGSLGRDMLSESKLKDLLHGLEYVLTYEDKDGDWMLVGDVPWELFIDTCKRLRIMKSSDAIGLAPRAMEKCKNRN